MISVKVKSSGSRMKELASLPKAARMAVLNAQRYAVSELKKLAVEETVSKYYLTKGQIKKAMQNTPAGFRVSSGMLSLEKYKLSPASPRKKYSLSAGVRKDTGMKPLGRNAFLVQGNGKFRPVARLTKRRYPIKPMYGPSIAQAVGNDETGELLQERAEELFRQKLEEAMSRLGMTK